MCAWGLSFLGSLRWVPVRLLSPPQGPDCTRLRKWLAGMAALLLLIPALTALVQRSLPPSHEAVMGGWLEIWSLGIWHPTLPHRGSIPASGCLPSLPPLLGECYAPPFRRRPTSQWALLDPLGLPSCSQLHSVCTLHTLSHQAVMSEWLEFWSPNGVSLQAHATSPGRAFPYRHTPTTQREEPVRREPVLEPLQPGENLAHEVGLRSEGIPELGTGDRRCVG